MALAERGAADTKLLLENTKGFAVTVEAWHAVPLIAPGKGANVKIKPADLKDGSAKGFVDVTKKSQRKT